MISKSKTNYVISLRKKKIRNEEGMFVIEGDKIVRDFLAAGLRLSSLLAVEDFLNDIPQEAKKLASEIIKVTPDELNKLSSLTTPHNALAVLSMFRHEMNRNDIRRELSVALDFVQDPGNFGTIIRSAAWFGIRNIICSNDCVDMYNPKVIQASMGAILHVKIFYTDLKKFLEEANEEKIKVFGAVVDGEPVYSHELGSKGIILLGNESKGISGDLQKLITDRITIPRFNNARFGIDSLNVSMAASIIISEFRRRF
jgi:TrmH family RNA methyltransferase